MYANKKCWKRNMDKYPIHNTIKKNPKNKSKHGGDRPLQWKLCSPRRKKLKTLEDGRPFMFMDRDQGCDNVSITQSGLQVWRNPCQNVCDFLHRTREKKS